VYSQVGWKCDIESNWELMEGQAGSVPSSAMERVYENMPRSVFENIPGGVLWSVLGSVLRAH
jgi:hypothetical protein